MGTTQYGEIDTMEVVRAVQMAIDYGITLFDTAEAYGPTISEEFLAQGLGNRRKDVAVVTKVGFTYTDEPSIRGNDTITGRDASVEYITARTDYCLQRLDTDCMDLLLVHWTDHTTPHGETIGDWSS